MSKDKLIQKLFEDNDVTSMKLDTPETTPEDLKVDDEVIMSQKSDNAK